MSSVDPGQLKGNVPRSLMFTFWNLQVRVEPSSDRGGVPISIRPVPRTHLKSTSDGWLDSSLTSYRPSGVTNAAIAISKVRAKLAQPSSQTVRLTLEDATASERSKEGHRLLCS